MGMQGFDTIKYLDWEWGFNLYTKIIVFFTRNEKIYFAITAFLCLAPVAWFIYKNSRNVWLSTLIYINLSFFYCTMNFLRQSMAIAIMLFAWHFLKKRKSLFFFLLTCVAAFFHTTAFIMLPMYFMVKLKPGVKTILLYGYGLLFFYISSDGFINLLTDIFHTEYKESVFIKEGLSFVYSIIPILISVIALIFYKKLIQLNPLNQYFINIVYYATFWMIIMSKHSILERLSYYPYIFVIILVPEIIEVIRLAFEEKYYAKRILRIKHKTLSAEEDISQNKKDRLRSIARSKSNAIAIAAIAVTLVILFSYNTFGMYVGEKGIHGVFPYETWLKL